MFACFCVCAKKYDPNTKTDPSSYPSSNPSSNPSSEPSSVPTYNPSSNPSSNPSGEPSLLPSNIPSSNPSSYPSSEPSSEPSVEPTAMPLTSEFTILLTSTTSMSYATSGNAGNENDGIISGESDDITENVLFLPLLSLAVLVVICFCCLFCIVIYCYFREKRKRKKVQKKQDDHEVQMMEILKTMQMSISSNSVIMKSPVSTNSLMNTNASANAFSLPTQQLQAQVGASGNNNSNFPGNGEAGIADNSNNFDVNNIPQPEVIINASSGKQQSRINSLLDDDDDVIYVSKDTVRIPGEGQ